MKQKSTKVLAAILSLVMVFSIFSTLPVTTFAAETQKASEKLNTYDTVHSTLAPGVTQTINQAYRDDGGYVKYFVAVADLSDPNVGLHATYGGAQGTTPGVTKMTQQIVDMTNLHSNPDDAENYIENYAIVAGVNGDGYNVGTGAPSGAHVMNGVAGFGVVKSGNSPWFAQFADGTIACGRNNTDWDAAVAEHGAVQEAIGGFQLLMKDGVVYAPGTAATQGGSTYWRPGFDYPCSFVGVTEEGKLILINCNGNGMGGSKGFDYDHTIEVAKELGVKDLLCLDGGGSATYLARPEGESDVVVVSSPSDGSERAVANGLVIYSTVPPSDVFKSAVLKTDATHYTPNSQIKVTASGVSPAGTPAEVPADVEWALSDASFGTIADGVFTSTGKTGAVMLQMVYQNAVVGEVEVNIVNPTTVDFEQENMVVPFGKTSPVKMTANYYDAETGGNFDVVFKVSDFTFTFSKENAGSLNGFELIAPEAGEASVTLTAVYKHCAMDQMSIAISYGKASELVWDFEDGDVSNWLGWGDAVAWVKENAPNSALGLEVAGNTNNQINGQCPADNDSYTFLATKDNGQVRNGDYALGFTLDETSYEGYGQWEYNILFNIEGQTVLRDVANGKNATTVGMWVYVPEDLTGVRYTGDTGYFAMEGQWYCGSSASNVEGYRVRNFVFQDTGLAMSATTDAGYTEVGKWVYMSADISAYDYVSLQNPTANTYREPSFIRFYFKRLEPKKYTFYFDDITLDYSSAVEDRDAPVISNPKYVVVDNGVGFGTVCNSNKVLFTANIADIVKDNTSGLDYSSAKIYVDGLALENVTASGNTMTSEEVTLTAGTHEVIFEIADNMGTLTRNKEMLTVSGNEPIWVTGHNDSSALAEYDSVYYMDLKVADAAAISKIETEISLNHANTWELPYLTVADGFTLEYEFVALTNSVKLTLTRDAGCALAGEQTLVSIPVRVWSLKAGLGITPEKMSTSGDRPIVPIDFEVEYGFVTYTSGNYNGYLGVFYDYYTTETKIQDQKYTWHLKHTATAMADVAATCTTAGYTGRTYCDVCKSVVDWGTVVPVTGHTYEVIDGVLKCACGERFTGIYTDGKTYVDGVVMADGWNNDSYWQDGVKLTGVQLVDGYYYNFGDNGVCAGQTKFTGKFYNEAAKGYQYAISGELKYGWYQADGVWNYFSSADFCAKTGTYTFINGKCAGITYVFDDEGNLTDGVWHTREDGNIQYFYGPDCYHWSNNMLQEIDGKTYCFDGNGYLYRGHQIVKIGAFTQHKLYHFDEVTGELLKTYEETGIFADSNGNYCYLVDGIVQEGLGMINIDGADYYVRGNGLLAVGKYYVGENYKGCEHLTPGYYDFGTDGKFAGPWTFTGVMADEEGNLHYYRNDVLQAGLGMITHDGDNYYVRGNGQLAVGKYYIGENYTGCGHLVPGYYNFGEDGKFVGPCGFVGVKVDEAGDLHYYYNDVIQTGLGLINVDGESYYVRINGLLAVGKYYIGTGYKGCEHLTPGYYDFGADGKFVGPWSLNGIIADEAGNLRYYVNDVMQAGLGMITIDGAEYYVRGNGLLAVGKYYIGAGYAGCEHLIPGYYDFGTDGKFVGPCGYVGVKADEAGDLHYYYNDVIQAGLGLITVDGESYYVRGNGLLAVGKYYIGTGYVGCEHLRPGYYNFGTDGKLVGTWGFTGVKADDAGDLHYYYNDTIQYGLGMITIDGAEYYVRGNGLLAVGKYFVGAGYAGCGHLTPGYYDFGEDGKFVGPWIDENAFTGVKADEAGDLHYYYNDVIQTGLGMITIDGADYYVRGNGLLAVGKYYIGANYRGCGHLTPGYYDFGEDGKFVGPWAE